MQELALAPTTGLDLRVLRIRHRLRAADIARELRVSDERVRQIERTAVPSAQDVRRYTRAVRALVSAA